MASFATLLHSLDPLYRLLVATDGTLTEMLEALSLEKMCLVKLGQEIGPATEQVNALDVRPGESLLDRKILLQGEQTNKTYLYARTQLAMDRLEEPVREGLLRTNVPLGLLLKQNRMETFKELLQLRREPARDLSSYFRNDPDTPLLVRTYRVFSGKQPVMLITEHLPCDLNGNGDRPHSLR